MPLWPGVSPLTSTLNPCLPPWTATRVGMAEAAPLTGGHLEGAHVSLLPSPTCASSILGCERVAQAVILALLPMPDRLQLRVCSSEARAAVATWRGTMEDPLVVTCFASQAEFVAFPCAAHLYVVAPDVIISPGVASTLVSLTVCGTVLHPGMLSSMARLQSLTLVECGVDGRAEQQWGSLLARLPALRRLSVLDSPGLCAALLAHRGLDSVCGTVEELALHVEGADAWSCLQLAAFPRLRRVQLSAAYDSAPPSVSTFIGLPPSCTCVDLSACRGVGAEVYGHMRHVAVLHVHGHAQDDILPHLRAMRELSELNVYSPHLRDEWLRGLSGRVERLRLEGGHTTVDPGAGPTPHAFTGGGLRHVPQLTELCLSRVSLTAFDGGGVLTLPALLRLLLVDVRLTDALLAGTPRLQELHVHVTRPTPPPRGTGNGEGGHALCATRRGLAACPILTSLELSVPETDAGPHLAWLSTLAAASALERVEVKRCPDKLQAQVQTTMQRLGFRLVGSSGYASTTYCRRPLVALEHS